MLNAGRFEDLAGELRCLLILANLHGKGSMNSPPLIYHAAAERVWS